MEEQCKAAIQELIDTIYLNAATWSIGLMDREYSEVKVVLNMSPYSVPKVCAEYCKYATRIGGQIPDKTDDILRAAELLEQMDWEFDQIDDIHIELRIPYDGIAGLDVWKHYICIKGR